MIRAVACMPSVRGDGTVQPLLMAVDMLIYRN